jgi:hypothetical protein
MSTQNPNEGMTIEAPYEETGPNDPNADPSAAADDGGDNHTPDQVDGNEPQDEGSNDTPSPDQEGDQKGDQEGDQSSSNAVASTLKAAGLNMDDFTREFTESGTLSEESFQKLEKAGFPRPLVEQYLAGAKVNVTIAKEQEAAIKGTVGGPEAYKALTQWAADNLNADEIEAYNNIMASGDIKAIKFAVAGLKARYDAQAEPNLIGGNARSTVTKTDVFRSAAEVVAAMKDPRYGKDPAYTRDVEMKLARSDVF